jgi:hypothetical protein
MSPRHGHERADRRNLVLHKAALDELRASPELRARCLALVEKWLVQPEQAHARRYLESWRDMLATWTFDDIAALVLDPDRGQALRQCSPLGPALTPQQRWRLLDEVNRALDEEEAGRDSGDAR